MGACYILQCMQYAYNDAYICRGISYLKLSRLLKQLYIQNWLMCNDNFKSFKCPNRTKLHSRTYSIQYFTRTSQRDVTTEVCDLVHVYCMYKVSVSVQLHTHSTICNDSYYSICAGSCWEHPVITVI